MTVPFGFKKVYYFTSAASLGLIGWAVQHFGETNLPPLLLSVRYLTLAVVANWFLSYALFVSDPRIETEKPRGWIWLAVIGAFLSLMHPVFSGDLMEYLIRGRMLGIYHVSPYRFIPNDFPNDLLRPYSIWVNNPDSYGPLSVYIQTLPAILFKHSITGMIWTYKMIVLGFYAVSVLFFWKIVHQLKLINAGRLWAMFAYCPLLVAMAFIDGHNDIIMMAFSVISLYFLIRRKYTPSFVFWTCGFLIKYMIILQLPFMVLYAVKQIWEDRKRFPWFFVFRQTALNVFLMGVCFAPIWGGGMTFLAILRQKDAFYTNTFPYLFYLLSDFVGVPVNTQFLKILFLGLFGVLYAHLLHCCWKKTMASWTDFFRVVSLCYLAFYAALPSPMGAWYMVWAVFWIVLARWPKDLTLLILYSAVGVLAFYKRPSFLAAIGIGVYFFSLKIPRLHHGAIRE